MQDQDNGMFSVTPLEEGDLSQFKEKAESDGYAGSIIDKALELAETRDVKSYREFEDLMDSVMNQMEQEMSEDRMKEERVLRSAKMEVSRLCKIENIAEYADTCIYNEYKTHSVSIMDILRVAPEEELRLDIYQEPIYSVLLQIRKDWVSEIVQSIMNSWVEKDYPKKFVSDYLRDAGIPEENWDAAKEELLGYLSDDYKDDVAPIEYKLFKAVQQILQQSRSDYGKMESRILSNQDSLLEYGATLEAEMESGMPAEAASASATEAASELLDTEDEEGEPGSDTLSGKAGAFCGKVLRFKYQTAKNFDDMLCESMGEFAPAYKENRSAIKARKEQLRKDKEQEKQKRKDLEYERELKEIELNAQRESLEIERERAKIVDGDSVENPFEEERRQREEKKRQAKEQRNVETGEVTHKRNFGPDHIPFPVIALVVSVFLGLIAILLFKGFKCQLLIAWMALAVFGSIRELVKKPYGIALIICGYLGYFLSLFFNIK